MTLWTVACQASLSTRFSRQEYWSGLPCPPPGDLHDPGIKPASLTSPASAGELPLVPPAKSVCVYTYIYTYSPPGSSVQGILQARTLEWVAISFSNACRHAESLQLCPTLGNPMDCSPPGSSVHEILQARILEWVAISFSRVSS